MVQHLQRLHLGECKLDLFFIEAIERHMLDDNLLTCLAVDQQVRLAVDSVTPPQTMRAQALCDDALSQNGAQGQASSEDFVFGGGHRES